MIPASRKRHCPQCRTAPSPGPGLWCRDCEELSARLIEVHSADKLLVQVAGNCPERHQRVLALARRAAQGLPLFSED